MTAVSIRKWLLLSGVLLIGLSGTVVCQAKLEDFEKGRHYQELGDYSRALIYYRTFLNDNPSKRHEEEARYRLAEACYQISAYSDAEKQFRHYLMLYPEGQYSRQAQLYLIRMEAASRRAVEQSSEMQPLNVREARIEQLERQVETEPDNALLRADLAEAYLDVGETGLARRALEQAEQKAGKYQEVKQIRKSWDRLEMIEKRAPMQATDLHGNPGPLRIQNADGGLRTNYRPSDEFQYNTYSVTGFVANESNDSFTNVQVDVALYDFTGKVIETRTVPVGRVGPLERRAFSASLYLHRSVLNQVHRYECRILY